MEQHGTEYDEEQPFRFSVRTLLLITTGVCVLGAILSRLLEPSLQIVVWVVIATNCFVFIWTVRVGKSNQRRLLTPPKDSVTVQVDAKWLRRIRSPWFYLVAALTGVSVSFAPLALIWCGDYSEYGVLEWILVPTCLLVIYFVPGFYMRLAGEVLAQLHLMDQKESTAPTVDSECTSAGASHVGRGG